MLGHCIALESLNLSQNSFQGSILKSFGNLLTLMVLDLNSSTIPFSLKGVEIPKYLNLTFNKVIVGISKGNFYANQIICLIGNPNLCGPQVFLLNACPTSSGIIKL